MKKLFLATSNVNKIEELSAIFFSEKISFTSPHDYKESFPEVIEGEISYLENACKKALQYSIYTGLISLADDTGLEVEALDGAPGPLSSRYFENTHGYKEKYLALIDLLKKKKSNNFNAKFVCETSIAYKGEVLGTFRGELQGSITFEPRGAHGFGYDPVFLLSNGRTLAELSSEEKNKISHRAIAVRLALPLLKKLISEK